MWYYNFILFYFNLQFPALYFFQWYWSDLFSFFDGKKKNPRNHQKPQETNKKTTIKGKENKQKFLALKKLTKIQLDSIVELRNSYHYYQLAPKRSVFQSQWSWTLHIILLTNWLKSANCNNLFLLSLPDFTHISQTDNVERLYLVIALFNLSWSGHM